MLPSPPDDPVSSKSGEALSPWHELVQRLLRADDSATIQFQNSCGRGVRLYLRRHLSYEAADREYPAAIEELLRSIKAGTINADNFLASMRTVLREFTQHRANFGPASAGRRLDGRVSELRRYLEQLDWQSRTALVLFYSDGVDRGLVCKELGVSESEFRSVCHRARTYYSSVGDVA